MAGGPVGGSAAADGLRPRPRHGGGDPAPSDLRPRGVPDASGRGLLRLFGGGQRRPPAVLEDGPDLDLSPWTADFRDQNDTFTPEEMDRLTAPPEALPPLSRAGVEEDVETLFTLLRTTYWAYT